MTSHPQFSAEHARKLYAKGWPYYEIAFLYRCSFSEVFAAIRTGTKTST